MHWISTYKHKKKLVREWYHALNSPKNSLYSSRITVCTVIQDILKIGPKKSTNPWALEHESERCEQTSERRSEWPSTYVPISRGFESLRCGYFSLTHPPNQGAVSKHPARLGCQRRAIAIAINHVILSQGGASNFPDLCFFFSLSLSFFPLLTLGFFFRRSIFEKGEHWE